MLRVMSFNIRYGLAEDSPNHWTKRRQWAAERILAFQPDLLGLQECQDNHQAAYLHRKLAGYGWVAMRRGGVGSPDLEMAPVLYKRENLELLQSGVFWLSETPDIPGSKYPGSVFARTLTWARLRLRQPPFTRLVFINTHFDYFDPTPQALSARQTLDFILSLDEPVILTGDFNANKDSAPYQMLLDPRAGLQDAHRSLHPTSTSTSETLPGPLAEKTFHGFGADATPASIDWILASQALHPLDAGIDRSGGEGLYPSDHYPVWACFSG